MLELKIGVSKIQGEILKARKGDRFLKILKMSRERKIRLNVKNRLNRRPNTESVTFQGPWRKFN